MKKNLLILALALVTITTKSQVIIDTVAIGAGYANQVWYSLANDNQGTAPKNNWDLAFDASGQGSTILINSVTGTTLWQYPSADTTGWNTLDTTGINSWSKRWNSDTSWAMGAMGRYASISNSNDLDWGIYSSITHIVTGDSLYVIKLASGAYKKLHIRNLSSGAYNFRYADINGANLQNATLTKSNYTGQNFGYYSIQNNTALSREPLSANWDLLFGQYTTYIPSPYTVTGILHNKGVKVAEVKPIANANSYVNWSVHPFKNAINTIGYDWKVFTTSFIIEDSLVYFVQSKPGAIWKVIPTGFGGSANGNNIFSKEMISAVGINEANGSNIATMALYPNPSQGNDVTIILSTNELVQVPVLKVYDLNGKLIKEMQLNNAVNNQMNLFHINTEDFENGIYVVNLTIGNSSANQKLVITK
ncbi:MAG: T9SS type A sorting domain-containing protein [Bacteroidota bacterium]|nr:T9SS type A sorting domain-containing protein [Bacteroidota bacterium]